MKNLFDSLKNIKICVIIVGCVVGAIMYNCFYTDFYYSNLYINYCFSGSQILNIHITSLIFFIMYYELKKMMLINILCLIKHKRIAMIIYFLFSSIIISIQICMIIFNKNKETMLFMMLAVIERVVLLIYYSVLEKIIERFGQNDLNQKKIQYKIYIGISVFVSNIIMLGIISVIIALIVKLFFV